MKDRENEATFVKEDDQQFVIADNENTVLERALKLMSRAVTRERIAKLAQQEALEDKGSEVEGPASELWREMPELAREHEAYRSGDGLDAEDIPVADDWEFEGFGGVTA